jgi:hypothetical protein
VLSKHLPVTALGSATQRFGCCLIAWVGACVADWVDLRVRDGGHRDGLHHARARLAVRLLHHGPPLLQGLRPHQPHGPPAPGAQVTARPGTPQEEPQRSESRGRCLAHLQT